MIIDFNDAPQQHFEKTTLQQRDHIQVFLQALAQNNISAPENILIDGELHRSGTRGKCYYAMHQGKKGIFGIFGDWSMHDTPIKFSSISPSQLTPEDIAEHERILADNRAKLQAEKIRKQNIARKKAKEIWDGALNIQSHAYLTVKKIFNYGLKVSSNGELLIPMRDESGTLHSIQTITDTKKFLYGGRVLGCSHTIPGDDKIYLCEGYATAATIHAATGGTCIVAFDSGNLRYVAKQIKNHFTICADNDIYKPKVGNVGLNAANSAAKQPGVSANVIIPIFTNIDKKPTDFNDLAILEGIDAVKKQLIQRNSLSDMCLSIKDLLSMEIPTEPCFLYPWLKENSINIIYGWRGCGKSWFVLSLLDSITRNKPFLGWECNSSVPCMYLDAEMTMRDDQKRARTLHLGTRRKNPLYLLSNEHLVKSGLPSIVLTDPKSRLELKDLLISKKIKLWVADNISSLSPGGDENTKQDWDEINQWVMDLRFNGITTIMLHHANKTGGQRGTSAREDNLDTVINLVQPEDYKAENGAHFTIRFEKNRGVDSDSLYLIKDRDVRLISNEGRNTVFAVLNAEEEPEITKSSFGAPVRKELPKIDMPEWA